MIFLILNQKRNVACWWSGGYEVCDEFTWRISSFSPALYAFQSVGNEISAGFSLETNAFGEPTIEWNVMGQRGGMALWRRFPSPSPERRASKQTCGVDSAPDSKRDGNKKGFPRSAVYKSPLCNLRRDVRNISSWSMKTAN